MRARHILGLALAAVLWAAQATHAQNQVTFESITFAASSIGFTATTIRPDGLPVMTVCSGRLETAEIRIRYDNTAPTATVGQPVEIGDVLIISGLDKLTAFRGIRTGSTSGVIQFQCAR